MRIRLAFELVIPSGSGPLLATRAEGSEVLLYKAAL